VAVDGSGNVYVTNYYLNRVQKFTSDGTYLTQWETSSSSRGVAVDASGNVYVADDDNCIQVFGSSGGYLTQWGTQGTGDGQFEGPFGVAVDGSGNVYVTDHWNDRIQVFGPLPVPAQSTSWGRIKALYR